MNDFYLHQTELFAIPAPKQAELTTLGGAIQNNIRRAMRINENLASDTLEGQAIEMTMQKFGQIAHVSQESLDRMNAKTVAQELRDILDAEQELKSIDPSVSDISHQHNMAEMVSAAATRMRLGGRVESPRISDETQHFHIAINHFPCLVLTVHVMRLFMYQLSIPHTHCVQYRVLARHSKVVRACAREGGHVFNIPSLLLILMFESFPTRTNEYSHRFATSLVTSDALKKSSGWHLIFLSTKTCTKLCLLWRMRNCS